MRVRIVNRNTALNPVARAIAQKKLERDILIVKLKLYMTPDGAVCADFLEEIALLLATVGVASELDPAIGGADVGVRILRGGMSACQALIKTDKWSLDQAVAIERAVDEAQELNKRVHPKYIAQANAMRTEIYNKVKK
jgi:hypothetical protein